jgi:uncharacterized protein (UPF0335 family)
MSTSPVTQFDLVSGNFNAFRGYASQSVNNAQSAINSLSGIALANVNAAHGFGSPAIGSGALPVITDGGTPLPDDSIDIPDPETAIPGAPGVETPRINIPAEPTLGSNVRPPTINLGPQPDAFNEARPGPRPTLTPIELPPDPELDDIDLPVLIELNVPDFDPVLLPTFQGVRPVRNFEPIDNTFNFTPVAFNDALLDSTRARLQQMQQGGTGLPAAIEQALFERAREREERETERAVHEVFADAANRGFDIPPGAALDRVAEVRQQAANRRAGLSRDILIKQHETEVENLRFSVTQGVALVQVLVAQHFQFQELALRAEQTAIEVAVQVLNARIAIFNAEQQAYQTDAQVFRDRIAAARDQVDMYRIRVEAEVAKNQINRDNVQLYAERIRAHNLLVERFRAFIEARRVQSEINEQSLRAYQAEVQAFGELARVHGIEWEAYAAQARAQESKVSLFDSQVRAYATNVSAWAQVAQTRIEEAKIFTESEGLRLRGFEASVTGARALLEKEQAVIQARLGAYQATSQRMLARTQARQAEEGTRTARLGLQLQENTTRAQLTLEQARINISQMQETARIAITQFDSIARTQAQLAAAALSAINVSASVSAGSSIGVSYNYSGEI